MLERRKRSLTLSQKVGKNFQFLKRQLLMFLSFYNLSKAWNFEYVFSLQERIIRWNSLKSFFDLILICKWVCSKALFNLSKTVEKGFLYIENKSSTIGNVYSSNGEESALVENKPKTWGARIKLRMYRQIYENEKSFT